MAGWQSGYAAACKAVDAGSIPTPASIIKKPCLIGHGFFVSAIKQMLQPKKICRNSLHFMFRIAMNYWRCFVKLLIYC